MNRKQQVLDLVRSQSIVSAKDVQKAGISRNYLYYLHREGLLQKNMAGLYWTTEVPLTENIHLVEIAKKFPHAVVCLISALQFHQLTTQISPDVWLTVPRGTWRPHIEYPVLNMIYRTDPAYSYGIDEHIINHIAVKIYNPAKTVADCFKFRNKIGLDIAIEALRESWRLQKITVDDLVKAAEINRVLTIMRPYMEAIL